MSLKFVTVPEAYATAALNHFHTVNLPQDWAETHRSAQNGPYTSGAPHFLYNLQLSHVYLIDGRVNHLNDLATPSSLTYLVTGAKGGAGAVHLPLADQIGGSPSTSFGDHYKNMPLTLRKLAVHPAVVPHPYEVRFLRSFFIYVTAVWLRHGKGGEDLIIPLAPTMKGLTAERIYTVTEFAPIMRELAKERDPRFNPPIPMRQS